MSWENLRLEEYKLIKSEIYHLTKIQISIVGLGISLISLVVGFSLRNYNNLLIFTTGVFIGLPILSTITLIIWYGAVEKMVRNGWYLTKIEESIKKEKEYPIAPIRYENWVRGENELNKKFNVTYKHLGIITLFLGFQICGLAFGFYRIWKETNYSILITRIILGASIIYFIFNIAGFLWRGIIIKNRYGF